MHSFKNLFFHTISRVWPEWLNRTHDERGGFVDIVCAHGVHTDEMMEDGLPPTSSVSIQSFRANIETLARLREVVSLSDAVGYLKENRFPRKRLAVLSFDDSLLCTSQLAIPEVLRVGIPATVFVSTDILDTAEPYWWLRLDHSWRNAKLEKAGFMTESGEEVEIRKGDLDSMRRAKNVMRGMHVDYRNLLIRSIEEDFGAGLTNAATEYRYAEPMSWDDVKGLVDKGINVGSHTVTHANLETLSPAGVEWEIGESKRRLEQELGISCGCFCYPYGKFAPWVPAMVSSVGYQCATTTIAPGRNFFGQELFHLRRYSVTSEAYKLGYQLSGFSRLFKR